MSTEQPLKPSSHVLIHGVPYFYQFYYAILSRLGGEIATAWPLDRFTFVFGVYFLHGIREQLVNQFSRITVIIPLFHFSRVVAVSNRGWAWSRFYPVNFAGKATRGRVCVWEEVCDLGVRLCVWVCVRDVWMWDDDVTTRSQSHIHASHIKVTSVSPPER